MILYEKKPFFYQNPICIFFLSFLWKKVSGWQSSDLNSCQTATLWWKICTYCIKLGNENLKTVTSSWELSRLINKYPKLKCLLMNFRQQAKRKGYWNFFFFFFLATNLNYHHFMWYIYFDHFEGRGWREGKYDEILHLLITSFWFWPLNFLPKQYYLRLHHIHRVQCAVIYYFHVLPKIYKLIVFMSGQLRDIP